MQQAPDPCILTPDGRLTSIVGRDYATGPRPLYFNA